MLCINKIIYFGNTIRKRLSMRKSYKIILMVISILLIGSIIIGTSYSIWVKTAIQKEQNIVNSSCFDIEFTESSSINLANAIPISDEDD